jgi:hypothetical protein
MSLSNLHGRVFEYCVVKEFLNIKKLNVLVSEKTIRDNKRDDNKLTEISSQKLEHFKKSSSKIVKWILNYIGNFNGNLFVERLSDEDGKKGDVTDVRLSYENHVLNLSLKNNHLATKHQRPGPTPKHLGISKDSLDFMNFNKEYKKINRDFYSLIKSRNENIEKYNEVEDLKFKNLYRPICNLVSDFINKFNFKSDDYLTFLIGSVNFKKIILFKDHFKILSFDGIPRSSKMNSWVENDNYVVINFQNDVIMKMRLHTASSRLTINGSLKFDTQIQKMNVDSLTIQLNN